MHTSTRPCRVTFLNLQDLMAFPGSLQFSTCPLTTCPPASLLAQAPHSLHPCLSTLQPWQGGGAPAASDLLVDATLGLQLQESQRAVLTYQVRAWSPAPPSPALSCRLPALAQRPRLAARALVAAMQAKQRRSEREWLRPAAVALARASARSTCRAPAVAAGSAAQGPTPAPAAHQRVLAGKGWAEGPGHRPTPGAQGDAGLEASRAIEAARRASPGAPSAAPWLPF